MYELLLVYRVDRLSRNVRQLAQLAEELEKAGVALRSATEPFDTSSPAGKMMLQMLGVFAEFERATIVERITAGMERAASQGRWVVGRVPYGYVRDRIAKVLNAEGRRTKNGTPFCARIILAMLNNPIYAGKVEFRGTIHPGLHEPIVDHAITETVLRILEERGESQALKRGHPSDYVLSGVVRCGRCSRAYVGTSARGRRGLYHYYVCSTRYRYGTGFCQGDRLPKDDLEEAVIEQMQDVYRDTSLIDEAMATAATEDGELAEDPARRLAELRQDLAGAGRSLDRYFAAFEEGSLSPADCHERIAKLKARIDSLVAEEASLARRAAEQSSEALSPIDVTEWARDLGALLRAGSAQQRKAVFRLLVKELRVMSREEIRPTYRVPALVRAPDGQVDLRGFEPLTSCFRSSDQQASDLRSWLMAGGNRLSKEDLGDQRIPSECIGLLDYSLTPPPGPVRPSGDHRDVTPSSGGAEQRILIGSHCPMWDRRGSRGQPRRRAAKRPGCSGSGRAAPRGRARPSVGPRPSNRRRGGRRREA